METCVFEKTVHIMCDNEKAFHQGRNMAFNKQIKPMPDQFEEEPDELMLKTVGYIGGIAQEQRVTELSDEQEQAIEFVKKFLFNDTTSKYKVIGGVAGSGKSTIIPYMIQLCGQSFDITTGWGNVAICAYTGKAVMNLKRKGMANATTLHSFLYVTKYEDDPITGGKKVIYTPRSRSFFRNIRLLIVDEASMVNKEMYDQIMSLPFKTLYIGDHFQLPPVNDNFNIMRNPDFKLERIHRQEEGNPIVQLADLARHQKPLPLGIFGSSKHTRSFDKDSLVNFDEIITWTNATKDAVNDLIRLKKGFPKDDPQEGDKMIVKMNNRGKNVYNGQIVYLMSQPTKYKHGGWNVEFVDELAYNDPYIMAQTDSTTKAIASVHLPKSELDRLRSLPPVQRKDWGKRKQENPYQIHLDWGYAITCHAAQGTSWQNIAVMLEDRMKGVMTSEEYSRFVYTAITRAEESVTIFSGDFRGL